MRTISYLNLLQILIAFLGLFFCVFLLTERRGKRTSNAALALVLGLLAAQMVMLAARPTRAVAGVELPRLSGMLYGPLFYVYVRALAFREFRLGKHEGLHLVPYVVAVFAWTFSLLSPRVLALAVFASMTCYISLSFAALHRYRQVLENTRSNVAPLSLNWLRLALAMAAAIITFDVLSFGTSVLALGARAELVVSAMLFLLLLFFVSLLVFNGLRHPGLFAGITLEDQAISEAGNAVDDFTPEELCRVKEAMENDRHFLNPDLTLADLSANLGIPARRLSRVIRGRLARNFSEFINSYRIDEAMAMLTDPTRSQATILETLYTVGFNSKSSFNAAFKGKTGMTPSQFRARYRQFGTHEKRPDS